MNNSRAWVLREKGQMKLETFGEDTSSRMLKVHAVGLCGTDVHAARGRLPLPYPVILGHEIVGSLERTANSKMGDQNGRFLLAPSSPCGSCPMCQAAEPLRCCARKTYGINLSCSQSPYLLGGFSEYVALLPGYQLISIPESLPTDLAILAEPLACVLSAYERVAPVRHLMGASVAVLGGGPIGLLTAITAELLGGQAYLLETKASRRQLARRLGINVLDPAEGSVPLQAVDIAFDCAGSAVAVTTALKIVRRAGTVVIFGSFAQNDTIQLDPAQVCNGELSILGASTTSPPSYSSALRLLSWHMDRFRDIITDRIDLFVGDSLQVAIEKMEQGLCGKICAVI